MESQEQGIQPPESDAVDATAGGQQPGIFVYVEEVQGAGSRIKIQQIGGFNMLAAPTLLELAWLQSRSSLGLKNG